MYAHAECNVNCGEKGGGGEAAGGGLGVLTALRIFRPEFPKIAAIMRVCGCVYVCV